MCLLYHRPSQAHQITAINQPIVESDSVSHSGFIVHRDQIFAVCMMFMFNYLQTHIIFDVAVERP